MMMLYIWMKMSILKFMDNGNIGYTESADTETKDNSIGDDDGLDLNENAFLVLCVFSKMHCLRGK